MGGGGERHHGFSSLTYLSCRCRVRVVSQAGQVELSRSPLLCRPACRLRLSPLTPLLLSTTPRVPSTALRRLCRSGPSAVSTGRSGRPAVNQSAAATSSRSLSCHRLRSRLPVSKSPFHRLRSSFSPVTLPPGMPSLGPSHHQSLSCLFVVQPIATVDLQPSPVTAPERRSSFFSSVPALFNNYGRGKCAGFEFCSGFEFLRVLLYYSFPTLARPGRLGLFSLLRLVPAPCR